MSTAVPYLPSMTISRSLRNVLLCLCVLAAAAVLLWPHLIGAARDVCTSVQLVESRRCATGMNKLLGYIVIIAAFPAILMLERFWPARESQERLSAAVLVDFLWFAFSPVFVIAFVLPIEDALRRLYLDSFGLPVFPLIQTLPIAVQIIVVVLLGDFMGWLAHVVRHKSSFVWEFHKIHHAQEDLNYFSTSRIHPIDSLVVTLVRFLPFMLLETRETRIAVPAFAVWVAVSRIYVSFTHSNVRTNLGPLKYVLVTPQSHRVHHSDLPEHQDKNFANIFSIWDFVFGTQVLDFETYPETGVKDKSVPRPVEPTLIGALKSYFWMLVYPFVSLLRRLTVRTTIISNEPNP